jgi:hypothetical protein
MAWIKMDIFRLMQKRIVVDLMETHGRGDHSPHKRFVIFLGILGISATYDPMQDAHELSRRIGESEAQCAIVWNACIDHGVLTPCEAGYTAEPWLRSQGMLGNAEGAPKARKEAPARAPSLATIDATPSIDDAGMKRIMGSIFPNVNF